jgi:RNA polymerase sigma-70 factor (ECF subfamily)
MGELIRYFARLGVVFETRHLNGQPGAIFRDPDGRVLSTLTLDVLDGRITAVRGLVNPDKLGHLGPVADAYALRRAAESDSGKGR